MARMGPAQGNAIRNVVILACAVDAADKALLPATFKALAAQLHAGPAELAALTFAQSMSFSLALPLWGSLMRLRSTRDLLASGCCLWAAATFCLACTTSFRLQLLLRSVNGAALAAVNPLGQALLCSAVPEAQRGRAFGLLSSASSAVAMLAGAAATATASASFGGLAGWQWAHLAISGVSFGVAALVRLVVPASPSTSSKAAAGSWLAEQQEVVRMILSKPSFIFLVLQGVTGGIPWNSFAFLPLFFQLSGYTDWEVGRIALAGGLGGVVGGYLGGALGDCMGRLLPDRGRIAVAQASVVLGMVFFTWLMHIPHGRDSFFVLSATYFAFQATAIWTPPAACQPICGSIFQDSRDRAQVLALWIALEGIVTSLLGAPLTGAISEAFGFRLSSDSQGGVGATNLHGLQSALLGVALVPWALCFLAWLPLYWAYPRDRCPEEPCADEHLQYRGETAYGLRPTPRARV